MCIRDSDIAGFRLTDGSSIWVSVVSSLSLPGVVLESSGAATGVTEGSVAGTVTGAVGSGAVVGASVGASVGKEPGSVT